MIDTGAKVQATLTHSKSGKQVEGRLISYESDGTIFVMVQMLIPMRCNQEGMVEIPDSPGYAFSREKRYLFNLTQDE